MRSKFIPVDSKSATAVGKTLSPILLDTLELYSQVKTAHWNLRGTGFIAVHKLLDEVADAVSEAADEIAERIGQLGQPVSASTKTVASSTSLAKFPEGELTVDAAVSGVSKALQATIKSIRGGIDATSGKVDEPITADILTGISGTFEKYLWLLASNLE